MTDEITRACETCKHWKKTAVDNPCRNCLPSPWLPSWKPAEVEQTPAARIAELEAQLEECEEALICMVEQYLRDDPSSCSGDPDVCYTHVFMYAGETAFEYLVKNGLAKWDTNGVDIVDLNRRKATK
jgi:hypothetical protein